MTESCQRSRELASAYLDNELSATESLAVERHLHECADCSREASALAALSGKIRSQARYHIASPALADRVRTASAPATLSQPVTKFSKPGFFSRWVPMTGAAAMAILIAGVALWQFAGRNVETRLSQEILSSHIRSTLSQQPFDIASADRHTVKPWFRGKLNFAPPVVDLAAQGFVLQGGRLDFVDGRTVPVIVYGRRKHVVNLYVWPNPGHADQPPKPSSVNGYNLIGWQSDGMRLSAISDLAAGELAEFARQFIMKSASEAPNS
ncbi:MAG TPA: zf-HC2 domain-containing protein [Candidatus Limnocylindria bacterium]|nr:zf-HC2 domain-containing protein [Candidatus Limnocylindria bacterium]